MSWRMKVLNSQEGLAQVSREIAVARSLREERTNRAREEADPVEQDDVLPGGIPRNELFPEFPTFK